MERNMLLGSDVKDGVITITLYNASDDGYMGVEFVDKLGDIIRMVYDNDDIRGVIIIGDGDKMFSKGFSAGDIALLNELNARKFSEQGQEVCSLIEGCHKPIIAAINGDIMNAGLEIAMACHIRVASENANLGFSAAECGFIPSFGGTQRLPSLVGKSMALELTMTCRTISAGVARDIGLVNHVVSYREALVKKSSDILRDIFGNSSLSVGMLVDCINAAYNDKEDGYQTEANGFAHCCNSDEFKGRVSRR